MSKIEWTDVTWNPVSGCTPISPGCQNCYAMPMAARLQKMGVKGYENGFAVTVHPERYTQPCHWRKPRMIFVCSMADLFHDNVPDVVICSVYLTALTCSHHIFQVLTKRPERIGRTVFKDMIENVWLGVTVESQEYVSRIEPLLAVKGHGKRFVSVEPMLGRVTIPKKMLKRLDWVIIGCESIGGRVGRLPHDSRHVWIDNALALVDQCKAANVPVFVKQIPGPTGMVCKDVTKFPPSLRHREFPK